MQAIYAGLVGISIAVASLFGLNQFSDAMFGAQPAFTTFQGGTGTSSPSGILFGDSTIRLKTLIIGSNLSFSTTTGILSATGGGGSGTVSTSTNETAGGLAYWTSNSGTPALLGQVATGTLSASAPLSLSASRSLIGGSASLTLDTSGTWSGNAGTASALAANGSNCTAGFYPLGVSAVGASENCTYALATTSPWAANQFVYLNPSGIAVSAASSSFFGYTPLNPTRQITVAGTANQISSSAGAQDLSADRTWTLSLPNHVIFPSSYQASLGSTTNATSTNLTVTGYASTSALTVSNLNSVSCDVKASPSGVLSCGTDAISWPFTATTHWGQAVQSTTTALYLQGTPFSLFASNTAQFSGATSTLFTATTAWLTNLFIGVDTIAEYIADTTGAMFSGNTETDITVTYDDADNTIDLVVDTLPNLTGTLDYDSGGTGTTTAPVGQVLYGGESAYQSVATSTPTVGSSLSYTGTFGNVLGGSSGTLSLNLGNANTWTALQTFANASSTLASFSYASSTVWRGGGLDTDCDTAATSKLLWDITTGQFSCGTDQTGGGGAFPFTPGNYAATVVNATTTALQLQGGLYASSTVRFGDAGVSPFVYSNSNGFVGIGTATPSRLLSVDAGPLYFDVGNNPVALTIQRSNTNTSNTSLEFRSNGGVAWYLGLNSLGNYAIRANNSTISSTPNFTIASSTGFTGISTSTPYARLSVWGQNTTAGFRAFEVIDSASTTNFYVENGGLTGARNFIANASSTIGSGAQEGGLTISGGATTTGLLIVQGTGTSTITSGLLASRLSSSATSTFAGIQITSNGLNFSGVNCSGSGQLLQTDSSGNVVCGTDDGGAGGSPGGSSDQLQFNDGGTFGGASTLLWDKTRSVLELGTTTGWGLFSIASTTPFYSMPLLAIGTSSDPGGDLLTIYATTTTLLYGSNTVGTTIPKDSGVRLNIGYSSPNGYLGGLDQVNVNGRINTGDWNFYDCSASGAGSTAAVAVDSNNACIMWGFAEDTNGALVGVSDSGQWANVQIAAGIVSDGAGMFLGLGASVNAATNTPVMEASARRFGVTGTGINNSFFATSSYYIGFTNVDPRGATFETEPTLGCYWTASSTKSNWVAVCRNGLVTQVDSNLASSTQEFNRFRVEMDSTGANFYIQHSDNTTRFFTRITTNYPVLSSLTPSFYMANDATGNNQTQFAFQNIRAWIRSTLNQ